MAAPKAGRMRARRRFEGRALAAFVVAFSAAVLFGVVALLVMSKSTPLLHLDRSTSDELHEFSLKHKAFTSVMRFVSDLGSPTAWWIILAPVAIWLGYRRLFRLAAFVLVTALGSSLLNSLVKVTVDRARPVLVDPVALAAGKSFPSGHGQAAVVGYGILLAVFLPVIGSRWRSWVCVAAAFMVLLTGFSRIALGVHYLSDVIGAYLIGLVWLLGMVSTFRAWRAEEGKPVGDLSEGLEPDQGEQLAP
jgi:membrane-associated phospholipid phosphatase